MKKVFAIVLFFSFMYGMCASETYYGIDRTRDYEAIDSCSGTISNEMSLCIDRAKNSDDFMKCVDSDLAKDGLRIRDVRFADRYCKSVSKFVEACFKLDLSNAGMTNCASMEAKIYDTVLNIKYKIALAKIDAEIKEGWRSVDKNKSLFVDAQKKWWQFKDAHCLLPLGEGGTMEYPMMASCQTEMTKERLKYLEDFTLPEYLINR